MNLASIRNIDYADAPALPPKTTGLKASDFDVRRPGKFDAFETGGHKPDGSVQSIEKRLSEKDNVIKAQEHELDAARRLIEVLSNRLKATGAELVWLDLPQGWKEGGAEAKCATGITASERYQRYSALTRALVAHTANAPKSTNGNMAEHMKYAEAALRLTGDCCGGGPQWGHAHVYTVRFEEF